MNDDEDLVILLEDDPGATEAPVAGCWKVVVIDDDPAVHEGTRYALHDYRLHNLGLDILSAYSAAEGRQLIANHPDTAVVLLDVVMETDTAGLELVGQIREELKNETVRIILRTGQPGQAPERRVIVDYDINDYKAKTELTADKLFTTLTAALRSYDQLRRLDDTRRGLEVIVDAASTLFDTGSVERLAETVLTGLESLIGQSQAGIAVHCDTGRWSADTPVIAGCGGYAEIGRPKTLGAVAEEMRAQLHDVFAGEAIRIGDTDLAVAIRSRTGAALGFGFAAGRPLSATDRTLVEVFCSRLPGALDNMILYQELQESNARLEERVTQRTEQLNRANAFKKEVLGIVAHDLKNPLSVILGRADMLARQIDRTPLPVDGMRKQVDQITQSARRMTGMIEGLIAEAMNDALDISVRPHPLDLARLIHTVAEADRPLADRKSQTITVSVQNTLWIRADYDRLREAIDNLVSNAIKYTPNGGRINLSAGLAKDTATICVGDNGPGLSEEDMSRIFGRFQRLSAQPTGGESSTGLGLSIVKRIVDLHGGTISARRASPQGGTIFMIELPQEGRPVPERGADQNGSPT
jgi:signal transduction histidine kinase/response regulator of citrate/malate metabolism